MKHETRTILTKKKNLSTMLITTTITITIYLIITTMLHM
jgi:hypothetical protein